jgi:hypothetical protein
MQIESSAPNRARFLTGAAFFRCVPPIAQLARAVTGESDLPFSRSLFASLVIGGAASEFYDRAIFSALPISGHTAKHILIFRWHLAAAR